MTVRESDAMDPGCAIRLRVPRDGFTLDVDLQLPDRGITVLFGPSGSGKTTLLRCVAGLERAPEGRVVIGGAVWQDEARGLFQPTWQRPLGYVFQEASLFEHLDVAGNLRFGMRRSGGRQGREVLEQAIELLGLQTLLQRRAHDLSGGERQRVAIARALATQPRLLLLDEPLAALDAARKADILPWLEALHERLSLPMLYVTHAPQDLVRLADKVVVLEAGRVKAAGPVASVLTGLDAPALPHEEVGALLAGEVAQRDAQWQLSRVVFPGGALWMPDGDRPMGERVRLRVLARDVSVTTTEPQDTSIQNHLPGVVVAWADDTHPSQVLLQVRLDDGRGTSTVLARVTRKALDGLQLQPGRPVWVQVKSVALVA